MPASHTKIDLGLIENEFPTEDIIGREPSWLVKSGISLIMGIFVILLAMSWFVSFPDAIKAPIKITTTTPPVELIAKVDGPILKFYVDNNQSVTKGQPIALIESIVNADSLFKLEAQLRKLKPQVLSSNEIFIEPELMYFDDLGSIQKLLNQFIIDYRNMSISRDTRQLDLQKASFLSLSSKYESLIESLDKQQLLWQKKIELEKPILEDRRELVTGGILSAADVLTAENDLIDKRLAFDQIKIQKELYNVKIEELNKALIEYEVQQDEDLQQLSSLVNSSYFALTAAINDWKQHYLISAPVTGQVSFSQIWSPNQHVAKGSQIVTIIQENKEIIGKITLAALGTGKVVNGQQVVMDLFNYPANEFGQLIGTVKSVSLVPGRDGYLVDVSIPSDFVTTHDKALTFSPNLSGTANIITEKKRLLERFFDKILFVFKKQ